MPYIEEVVFAGKTIEVSKKFSYRYKSKKVKREKNANPTPEAMKKINQRNAETKLRHSINENFGYKDIHLVLTYRRENRPTPEQAKTDLENFLRRLRAYFKKHGNELKYIAVTEYKSRAIHHHLVINSMDTRDLPDLWTHGQPRPTFLDDSGQYGQLAAYLIKETSKTFREEDRIQGKRWRASKNLLKPTVVKRVVSSAGWRKMPKPRKGYYIEKGSERFGTSELTGFQYQFYRMIKIPEKGGDLDHEVHTW